MMRGGEILDLHITIAGLMSYYYDIDSNAAGGILHIVLDDGNVTDSDIIFCHNECWMIRDTLGMFICDILLTLDELEREELYELNWGRAKK